MHRVDLIQIIQEKWFQIIFSFHDGPMKSAIIKLIAIRHGAVPTVPQHLHLAVQVPVDRELADHVGDTRIFLRLLAPVRLVPQRTVGSKGGRAVIPAVMIGHGHGVKKFAVIRRFYHSRTAAVGHRRFYRFQNSRISRIRGIRSIRVKPVVRADRFRRLPVQRRHFPQNLRKNGLRRRDRAGRRRRYIDRAAPAVQPDYGAVLVPVQAFKIAFQIRLEPEIRLSAEMLSVRIRIRFGTAARPHGLDHADPLADHPFPHLERRLSCTASRRAAAILHRGQLPRIRKFRQNQGNLLPL